jgi:hypothetical protein
MVTITDIRANDDWTHDLAFNAEEFNHAKALEDKEYRTSSRHGVEFWRTSEPDYR